MTPAWSLILGATGAYITTTAITEAGGQTIAGYPTAESSSTITYGVLVGFAVRLGKGSILALAIRVHLGTAFNLIYEPQIGVVFPNG